MMPETILIAGGTQGLGKGVALYLAECGVKNIIVCGRNHINGDTVVQLLKAKGCQAFYVQTDLTQVVDCKKVAEFCSQHFSSIDGVVYTAGLSARGTIETTDEAIWDKIFNLNVKGAFFLIQALLPLIRKGNLCSIVTICSFSSDCGKPELIAYNASKAALVTFTKSLANTLKNEKIRVNGIKLGWTDTDNERKIHQEKGCSVNWLDEVGVAQPFGRLLQPQDVAHLIEFLLSSKSLMMTGAIIDFNQHVRI